MYIFIAIVIVLVLGAIFATWISSEREDKKKQETKQFVRSLKSYFDAAKRGDDEALMRLRQDFTPEQLKPHQELIEQEEREITAKRHAQTNERYRITELHQEFLAEEDRDEKFRKGLKLIKRWDTDSARNERDMTFTVNFAKEFEAVCTQLKQMLQAMSTEMYREFLGQALTSEAAFLKLKGLMGDTEENEFLIDLEYPDNWQLIVAMYMSNPTIKDFGLISKHGYISPGDIPGRGQFRLKAQEAIDANETIPVKAKLMLAWVNSGRTPDVLEELLRVRLAEIVSIYNLSRQSQHTT